MDDDTMKCDVRRAKVEGAFNKEVMMM